jgi:hypothetical protein
MMTRDFKAEMDAIWEPRTPWAKGYAAGKESQRGELEWLRAEVERLRAAGITIEQLRMLTALQAEDGALWAQAGSIGEAYAQRALRILTEAIEGDLGFELAKQAITEMAA